MSFLLSLKDAIVAGAKFVFGVIKNVGPLKVVGVALSAVSLAIPVCKMVRKVVDKIKSRGRDKAPTTMTEAAMASPKTRAANPELNYQYNESTKRTARRVVEQINKGKKKNLTLSEMVNNLRRYDSIYAPKKATTKSYLAELVDSNPDLAKQFGRKPNQGYPFRPPIRPATA